MIDPLDRKRRQERQKKARYRAKLKAAADRKALEERQEAQKQALERLYGRPAAPSAAPAVPEAPPTPTPGVGGCYVCAAPTSIYKGDGRPVCLLHMPELGRSRLAGTSAPPPAQERPISQPEAKNGHSGAQNSGLDHADLEKVFTPFDPIGWQNSVRIWQEQAASESDERDRLARQYAERHRR